MVPPRCFRCNSPLGQLSSPPGIRFYDCSGCWRRYARRSGGQLTYAWLHPISLALYDVIYDEHPSRVAAARAAGFIRGRPREHLEIMIEEIRSELDDPTQPVRDILNCAAPEAELRSYLAGFADELEAFLTGERPDRDT